jgi:hypothetical protein
LSERDVKHQNRVKSKKIQASSFKMFQRRVFLVCEFEVMKDVGRPTSGSTVKASNGSSKVKRIH